MSPLGPSRRAASRSRTRTLARSPSLQGALPDPLNPGLLPSCELLYEMPVPRVPNSVRESLRRWKYRGCGESRTAERAPRLGTPSRRLRPLFPRMRSGTGNSLGHSSQRVVPAVPPSGRQVHQARTRRRNSGTEASEWISHWIEWRRQRSDRAGRSGSRRSETARRCIDRPV